MKIFYNFFAISFFSFPVIASADASSMVKSIKTHEYVTCSAFFAVLAHGMNDKPNVKARFDEMSSQMMEQAVTLSNEDYAGDSADEIALKMLAEMRKGESDAKAVVAKHVSKCKALIDGAVQDE